MISSSRRNRNNPNRRKSNISPLSYALILLSRKDYSVFEIKEKIERKFGEKEAEETVEKLSERGLLNDMRYAERIINRYAFVRKYGYLKVKNELLRRGLKYETFIGILDRIYSEEKEKENARSLSEKRPPEKLGNYLLSKGYRPHIVREILAELK